MTLIDALFIGLNVGCCLGMCIMMTANDSFTLKQFATRALSCAVIGAFAAFQVWRLLDN